MAAPMIPMKERMIKTLRRPLLIHPPVKAAESIRVKGEEEPIMLSLIVAVLPSQPNLALRAGVI